MPINARQALTWATLLAAVGCAGWLALTTPARTFIDADRDASVGVVTDVVEASLDDEPAAAGPSASGVMPAVPAPRASF